MPQWIVDPDHTVAAFSICHMMIAHVRGQFNKISGTLYFDPSNIRTATVDLKIEASSIFTGVQKRDDHLRSSDFFDVGLYPEITFRSTRIDPVDAKHARITGDLALHGITRQIIVDATFTGPVQDPFGDGKSIGFTASAKINREDYGLMWNQPMENNGVMVGREVTLFVDVEADLTLE